MTEATESTAATPAVCRNCGATLHGPYCHVCGQSSEYARSPFFEAIGIVLNQLFGADARIWPTLRKLVMKPGELTVQFVEGRQVSMVHPIRLFLIASVLALLTPDLKDIEEFVPPVDWAESLDDASWSERFAEGQRRAEAVTANDETRMPFLAVINHRYLVWIVAIALISMVPVLKIMRPRRLVYDHFFFVMHLGTFFYLSDIAIRSLGIRMTLVGSVALTALQVIYTLMAFRRVYPSGPTWPWRLLDYVLAFIMLNGINTVARKGIEFAQAWHAMP